jgi:hypothetical protein
MSTDPPVAAEGIDPRYVAARRVLLDALHALEQHGRAVIVVGAQAVYLQTGDAELAVAPFTTDGDLAIDPAVLGQDPALEAAMRAAGFELSLIDGHVEPGIWIATTVVDGLELTVPIDLIVPEGVAPPGGRRGARLEGHDRRAARRAVGLEAALIDHTTMTITALEPADPRRMDVVVAGPAALLVAKAHKLHDRLERGRADRAIDKDAADVVRLMQTSRPAEVVATMRTLVVDPTAGSVTTDALGFLAELFGRRGRPGIALASRALRLAIAEEAIETLCVAYMRDLMRALR